VEDHEFHDNFIIPLMMGEFDNHLDRMANAVKNRQQMNAPTVYDFKVGDRVKMKNANPKYLNGAEGRVVKINRTKVVVDLHKRHGRFYTNITTPTSMLERV
jgi:uncharacterized protein YkvS